MPVAELHYILELPEDDSCTLLTLPLPIMSETLEVKDAYKIDDSSFPYIYEENVAVPLKTSSKTIIRCNVYRPKSTKEGTKLPVLVTYGPYGKDIHYKEYDQSQFTAMGRLLTTPQFPRQVLQRSKF